MGFKNSVIKLTKDKMEVIKGLFPIEIKETEYRKGRVKLQSNINKKVPMVTMYVFCKQFSIMINAGVPIVQALDVLIKQEDNKRLKEGLKRVAENVHKGFSLSESMRQYDRLSLIY